MGFVLYNLLCCGSISMIEPIARVYNIVGDETTLTMLNGISILAMCGIILTITVTE